MVLSRILKQFGYEVDQAKDGIEALGKVKMWSKPADLILLDWNMPGLSGVEVLREIRGDAAFQATRIVMVTSEGELERVAEALDSGADEYVMKPFTAEMLRDKLHLLGLTTEEYETA